MPSLTVSVVVFDTPPAILQELLSSLYSAVKTAITSRVISSTRIFLIDNSSSGQGERVLSGLRQALQPSENADTGIAIEILSGHGNIGYGRANNLVINRPFEDKFYLILNPDVVLESNALVLGISYLLKNQDVVLLAPAVTNCFGETRHLCKNYPCVFDLFIRGFAPAAIRNFFNHRIERYTLSNLSLTDASSEIPIASGSFMLCRTESLKSVGGFDPGYFLYFEDFDLSLRMATKGVLRLLPSMRIRHQGGQAARKGFKHLWFFVRSGIRFFNHNGWRWF